MNIAKQIFNNQDNATKLINLFSQRYKIDENDDLFRWLCLNEVDDYFVFFRVFQLTKGCSVRKNEKGFDIVIGSKENAILIEDMKKWVLHRRITKLGYTSTDKIISYRFYKM